MEWKLLHDDTDDVDLNDVEVEIKDIVIDEDSSDEFIVLKDKPSNPRRAIEILREQKQLEADTWDYFSQ